MKGVNVSVFLYVKFNEDIRDLDQAVSSVLGSGGDLVVITENRRSFRELTKISRQCSQEDIIVVHSLESLGLNNDEKVAQLDFFVQNDKKLVICSCPSTFEYGVTQPMNKATLSTISRMLTSEGGKIFEFPVNRRSNSGRQKLDYPDDWEELYELWSNEKISSREFLQRSGLKKATFYNMITEYRNGLDNIEEYIRRYKCS